MAYLGNTPGVSSQRLVSSFIATAGQTTFTPSGGYMLGYVDVLINGIELDSSDFTAADGVNVVLASGAALNDEVKIKAWLPRGLSDGYTKSEADARYPTKANNLSDLASASTARTNLGLGTLSTVSPTGTASSSTYLRGDNAWVAVPAATPGGSTTQVQYNNAGAFAGSANFVFDGTNVGIGTSSPAQKLDIVGTQGRIRLDPVNISGACVINFTDVAASNFSVGALSSSELRINTAGTERMRINSSGNVGIGLNNPNERLTVLGNINLPSGANRYIRIGSGSNYSYDVMTATDDFQIREADLDSKIRLRIKYSSTPSLAGQLQLPIEGSSTLYNSYTCRAWVNFNGSGGGIRASGNVSSISQRASGCYSFNFATAMPDANYSVHITTSATQGVSWGGVPQLYHDAPDSQTAPTASSFIFLTSPGGGNDRPWACVTVFR